MAVTQNDEVVKQEVVNIFKTNLLQAIYSGVIGTENPPYFNGTAGPFSNPIAIDAGQLDSTQIPTPTIPNTIISASDTYTALKSIIDNLTRIRSFTSKWYYQNNDTLGLIDEKQGVAIFKATIPGLSAYSTAQKQIGYFGWDRAITGSGEPGTSDVRITENLTVTNPLTGTIQADQVQPYTLDDSLFKNLFDAWEAEKNKIITYNYYTCHSNCHSNWTESRSRR